MSAQDTMGKIIGDDERRDAIHIALAPVVASHRLLPGEDIGFVEYNGRVGRCVEKHIGIVDPFLKAPVDEGQRFWMFLYPNTITSLRHEWEHPAFVNQVVAIEVVPSATSAGERKATSIAWIKGFADELKQHYDSLMRAARIWIECEDYTYDNSEAYKNVDYAKWPIFWQHYEIVTGNKPKSPEDRFFTCSC